MFREDGVNLMCVTLTNLCFEYEHGKAGFGKTLIPICPLDKPFSQIACPGQQYASLSWYFL